MERAEPAEHLAQVVAAPAQALAGAADQQLQVAARVGVEHRQDLVRVHVRAACCDADRAALGHGGLAARARVEREEHVLQPGARPQQHGGVAAHEAVVLAVEVQPHPRAALVQLDLADVAHAHARHAHRLALPGRHALRVRSSTQTWLRRLLDEREAQALLGEDVRADADADREQAEHGHEVAQVLADRVPHGLIPSRLAWSLRPSPNH